MKNTLILLALCASAYVHAEPNTVAHEKSRQKLVSVIEKLESIGKVETQSPHMGKETVKDQLAHFEKVINEFQQHLALIEEGGEIYKQVIEAQESIPGNIKKIESRISSGNLSVDVQKKFEALIKRQQTLLKNYDQLLKEMKAKSLRLRAKIKELHSQHELWSAVYLTGDYDLLK